MTTKGGKQKGLRAGYIKGDERAAQIKALVAAGLHADQIAVKLGVVRSYVHSSARRHGFQVPRSPGQAGPREGHLPRKMRFEQIRKLVAVGHNRQQIAEITGLAPDTVGTHMMAAGLANTTSKLATPASPSRVATETVNILVGAAAGLGLFRSGHLAIDRGLAIELLPDLREAMGSLRRFEKVMKEMANAGDHEATQQEPVCAVHQDEDRGGSAEEVAASAPSRPDR